MSDYLETDVLIIGSGIAAFRLARAGVNVILTSRSSNVRESNTLYAQGGIIYKTENDSRQLLIKDILNAGADFFNPEHVRILATEGPKLVENILQHLGIWETRSHDPPACKIPHTVEFTYDDACSQIPPGDYFLQ